MKRILLLVMMCTMSTIQVIYGTNPQKPMMSRLYGSPFKYGIQQYNDAGTLGTLNDSYGVNGSLSMNAQLTGSSAKAVRTLADGSVLVLLDNGVNSAVAKYSATGVLETATFGASGICSLSGLTNAHCMSVDSQGNILVGGGTTFGSTGWLKRMTSAGVLDATFNTNFAAAGSWSFIGAIAQQSSGQYIVVGLNATGHTQLASFLETGAINAGSFGTGSSGYVIFNGISGMPNSTTGSYALAIDPSDKIYVGYTDAPSGYAYLAQFNPLGTLVAGFGGSGDGTIHNALGAQAVVAHAMYIGLNSAGNTILIAGTLTATGQIITNSYDLSDGGSTAGFTSTALPTSGSNVLQIAAIVTLDNGYFAIVSSDITNIMMRVDQFNATGIVDTNFNGGSAKEFQVVGTTGVTTALLYGAAVSQDGQVYIAGMQTVSTTTSYLSKIYDYQYVTQVPQYPITDQQGNFDITFGNPSTESFAGVPFLYNGNFGLNLQQKARSIIELNSGDFLIGSDGFTYFDATQTMMLTWLTSDGIYDTAFGAYVTGSSGPKTGKLILDSLSAGPEQIAALAVGNSGIVYVAGNDGDPDPILRSYTSASTTGWTLGTALSSVTDTGIGSVGIAIQGLAGILLFVADSSTVGHISRYTSTTGVLVLDDRGSTEFGLTGTAGKLLSSQLGLNMGPIYGGGLVDVAGNIIIAYKSTADGTPINIAKINKNGNALIPEFGTAGIINDVFSSASIDGTNVRIAFDEHQNIYIAAVNAAGTAYLIRRYDGVTGIIDTAFNAGAILSITPEVSPTALSLMNLTGLSDSSVMLTGYDAATDPVMLTLRVTSAGVLDTTFNPQGTVPGIVPFQIQDTVDNYNARVATSLAIQSSTGNVLVSAYEQPISTQSTPEVMRLFGQTETTQVARFPMEDQYPGTLDLALNDCGALDIALITSTGTAKVVYTYPDGNTHEGKILLGVDSGSAITIIRVDQVTLAYDTTFNPSGATPGLYTISSLTGLNNITIDNKNRIIICGTNAVPLGWARQIPENGITASVAFTMPTDIIAANQIYQQKSGRYIIAGSTSAIGTLVAFQDELVDSNTGLAVDTTFNPLATGSVAGRWNIAGSASLYNLAINSDDTMYVAYKHTTTEFLTIAQILANGSGLDTAFGSGSGILTTIITPDSNAVVRLVVDASQNVIVAASTESATTLKAFRCNSTGGTSTQFSGTGVTSGVLTVAAPSLGTTGVILKALLETEAQQTILVGSNSSGASTGVAGYIFAVRLTSAGAVDATWNPNVTSPYSPGILTFGAIGVPLTPAITNVSNAAIAITGDILAVGGNGTNPVFMEIVGDSYVNEVAQGQFAGTAGTLDYTLNATGALNLNTATGFTLGNAQNIYIYPDGSMLIASRSGTTTYLTKFDATLAVDTDFGFGGKTTITGTGEINDMFVSDGTDQPGYIYLTGTYSGVMWSRRVSADGLQIVSLPAGSLSIGGTIRQNLADNILVAGSGGSYGVVAAYTSDGLGLDPLFGVNGIYTSTSTNPIYGMAVDNYSRIYIAYKDGNDAIIERLLADGSGIDPTFTPVEWSPACNVSQIFLQLDINNNQLVVGTYYTNSLYVHRYSTIDGSSTSATIAISVGSATLNMSELFIDSDQNVYVVGYNSAATPAPGYQTVVARVASTSSITMALDATYGTGGIATMVTGPLTGAGFIIGGGALDPDRRVYVVGATSVSVPYMARVFGDNYYTQVSQALSATEPGNFDYTYGYDGVAINYADGASSPSSNQQVRAIAQLQQGTQIMTVISDEVHAWTVRLLSNGTNDSAYGAGQGIQIEQLAGVEIIQGMVFDGVGNSIIFGSNELEGGFVKSIFPSGSMNTAFGGYTGSASTVTYPTGTTYIPQVDIVNAVAQLSNGNFVFVGSKNGVGIIGMLSLTGGLISFGTDISGFVTNGADITSVSVDTDDNIYVSVGYQLDESKDVRVMKLNASGSLITSFGSGGIVDLVLIDSDDYAHNRLVFNASGRIIVAASGRLESGTIKLRQLLSDGSFDTGFNSGSPLVIHLETGTNAIVTSLVVLTDNKILISGYQHDGDTTINDDYEFVACVNSDGILDDTFNPTGTTPGLLTFQVSDTTEQGRYLWDMNIQVDGQILLAGSESPATAQSTPLTMRVQGYENIGAVPQFTGYQPTSENRLNLAFGDEGIAETIPVEGLDHGGDIVIDSQGRSIIAGNTSEHTFVVARFLSNGQADTSFGSDGVVVSAVVDFNLESSYVAINATDDIIVGGITDDHKFIAVKFSATDGSQVTSGFGTAGVAATPIISNLVTGGYMTVDAENRILIGGYTSNFTLVVARFLANGTIDSGNFNASATGAPAGVATTGSINYLANGGYVVTDSSNNVYLGGLTNGATLVVAKLSSAGAIVSAFGTSGRAATGEINSLVTAGAVALDTIGNVIIGGYTSNQTFVVARFLATGLYDPSFSTDGIAFSNPVGYTIDGYGDIAVDSNDSIILGGTAIVASAIPMTIGSSSRNMFAARWLNNGAIDTSFSSTGIAYTGVITGLTSGGFVATDVFDHVYTAGIKTYIVASPMSPPDGSLVVAQFYSGEEIFVTNPSTLSAQDYKIYFYGNNPNLFEKYLGIELLARFITNSTVQAATVSAVQNIFDTYAQIYADQLGWNLVLHTYREYGNLIAAQETLVSDYSGSVADINRFFDLLYNRIGQLTGHYIAG